MAHGAYKPFRVRKTRDPWAIYRKIFGELRRGAGTAIREQGASAKASAMQSLISRGLGGSTVRENIMTGIDRTVGLDLAKQNTQIAGQAMRMVPGMTPEPEMTPAGARSLGMTYGMARAGSNEVPAWFRKRFSGSRMNMPQRMRLTGM